MLIVFLASAANFGNSFCGNGPAPLQHEIQQYMSIQDTEFNMLYSIRSLSNLILPFFLATLI